MTSTADRTALISAVEDRLRQVEESSALGGATNIENLISLCYVHHRQVEHGKWDIQPTPPGTTYTRQITRRRI